MAARIQALATSRRSRTSVGLATASTVVVAGLSLLVGFVGSPAGLGSSVPDFSGTSKQRVALYESLLRDTLEWEAFCEERCAALELDFEKQAKAMRKQFVRADSERELYLTLRRFSNLRCNPSLDVLLMEEGLRVTTVWEEIPIRFGVEEVDPGTFELFVRDHGTNATNWASSMSPRSAEIEVGDRLVLIDKKPPEKMLDRLKPFLRYSTPEQMWFEFANAVPCKRYDLDATERSNDMTFKLRKPNGKSYITRISYDSTYSVSWVGEAQAEPYAGFESRFSSPSIQAYTPRLATGDDLVVLQVGSFLSASTDLPALTDLTTPKEDLEACLDWAEESGRLECDVILDLSGVAGGAIPWDLLQVLAPEPFRVTHGKLRLSEVTPQFVTRLRAQSMAVASVVPGAAVADDDDAIDEGENIEAWITGVIEPALQRGDAWTPPVPLCLDKLAFDSDGTLEPAARRFSGRRVLIVPRTENAAVNHVAAVWDDNDFGPIVGERPFGVCNAWVWRQPIFLPKSDRPLVEFAWGLGPVLRPDGRILERHPAQPTHPVLMSGETRAQWKGRAFDRALRVLEAPADSGSRP